MSIDLRGRKSRGRPRQKRCKIRSQPATFAEVTVYNGSTIRLDGSVIRHPVGESVYFCDRHSNRDLP